MTRRAGDPRGRGTSAWVTAVRERVFGNPTEKLMMMVLCDYINGDDECWPGNDTLAPDVGVDPRTIKRALARLEGVGVIERLRRQGKAGGRKTDIIIFRWEGFQQLPLVGYEANRLSPKGPAGSKDRESGLGDNLSKGLGDNLSKGLGDNLSDGLGDPGAGVRGSSNRGVRGQSTGPSSFRTPHEPPNEPPRGAAPSFGAASGPSQHASAASRPQGEKALAHAMVQAWWDQSTPKPVSSFIGVVKIVEKFLVAGYTEEQVAHGLRTATVPTTYGILLVLRKRRFQPSPADANAEAVLRWLEANSDFDEGATGGE